MMGNIIDLTALLGVRPQIEEMTLIVLADAVNDAFAEYYEAPDDTAFTGVLSEIMLELPGELSDFEKLKEQYWWAVARRYVINNNIARIDQAFCRSFNPYQHHVPALQWARKYLDTLPASYAKFLGGTNA